MGEKQAARIVLLEERVTELEFREEELADELERAVDKAIDLESELRETERLLDEQEIRNDEQLGLLADANDQVVVRNTQIDELRSELYDWVVNLAEVASVVAQYADPDDPRIEDGIVVRSEDLVVILQEILVDLKSDALVGAFIRGCFTALTEEFDTAA